LPFAAVGLGIFSESPSSIFIYDSPGTGNFRYSFSYISLTTNDYLRVRNTRMYIRVN
jgi:hypothetical protein